MKLHPLNHAMTLAAAATLFATAAASGQVLLSDSFNRTSGSNTTGSLLSSFGTNDNAYGGTLNAGYVTSLTRGGNAQQTVEDADGDGSGEGALRNGSVGLTNLNLVTAAPLGFIIDVELDRDPANTTGTGFVALALGADLGLLTTGSPGFNQGVIFPNAAGVDLGVVFQQDPVNNATSSLGLLEFFDNGTSLGSVVLPDETAPIDLRLTVAAPLGYDNGDLATLVASVNGVPLFTSPFTFDGSNSGRLAFTSNLVPGLIDDLVISQIPEPATLGLLGLGGLALARRRR